MTQKNIWPNSAPFQTSALFGCQISLLITLPFWLDRFITTGASFDDGFLERTSLLRGGLPHIDYAAGLLALIGLAVGITSLVFLIQRHLCAISKTFCTLLWIISLLPLLNYLRIQADIPVQAMTSASGLAVIFIFAGGGVFAIWRRWKLIRTLDALNTIFVFIGAVIIVNGIAALARTAPSLTTAFQDNRPLNGLPASEEGLTPLIWIIFDEWDYRISFEDRPPELEMPNIDRLGNESFVAKKAKPPAQSTSVSMPTLTTGLRILSSTQGRGGDLLLKTASKKEISWRDAPNIFDTAKSMGVSSAIFSHQWGPYCGSMHRSLSTCWDFGKWWREKQSAFRSLLYVTSYGLRFMPGTRKYITRRSDPNYRQYSNVDFVNDFIVYQNAVEKHLRTERSGLLFLHYEIPHFPIQFDRRTGKMRTQEASGAPSLDLYADNLALVDRIVSKIRKVLTQNGRWSKTALIISSDHHFRHGIRGVPIDLRVPLIVKLPGNQGGTVYRNPLNTGITTKLIPEIISGRVTNYQSLTQFIDNHSPPITAQDPVRDQPPSKGKE